MKKSDRQNIFKYSEDDIVHLASIQNEPVLKRNFLNIKFVHDIVDKKTGKRVVGIFLDDDNDEQIPSKLSVYLPDGTNHTVNIIVIKGLGKAKANLASGLTGSVALASESSYTGSACCILQDPLDNTKNYILTSCHVLTIGDLSSPLYDTDGVDVTYDSVIVGQWAFGCINGFGDYATVSLNDDFDIQSSGLTFPNGVRDINESADINGDFHVKSQFNDGNKNAYFHGIVCNKISIDYNLGHSQVYDSIMLLNDAQTIENGQTLTQHGDSGGAIYDANNILVGIIVGGDDKFSYAIPVKPLIDGLKLKTI